MYEELASVYDSHPFFLVRLAESIVGYGATAAAMDVFHQVMHIPPYHAESERRYVGAGPST
jgi:hypothetical protein